MAVEGLVRLSKCMDESPPSLRRSTFFNVVAVGNIGVGKSDALNCLIGNSVLPSSAKRKGTTVLPVTIDLTRTVNRGSFMLQIDNELHQVSPCDLNRAIADAYSSCGQNAISRSGQKGKPRPDKICLKLHTEYCLPLTLIDLPGINRKYLRESMVGGYAGCNDAIILIFITANQAPKVSSCAALRLAKKFDSDGTRTVGVITKIFQAEKDQEILAAVRSLLLNQGPQGTSHIQWVALGASSIQSRSVLSEQSLEADHTFESQLLGVPPIKLGRFGLIDTLYKRIHDRIFVGLEGLVSRLESQNEHHKLARLHDKLLEISSTGLFASDNCAQHPTASAVPGLASRKYRSISVPFIQSNGTATMLQLAPPGKRTFATFTGMPGGVVERVACVNSYKLFEEIVATFRGSFLELSLSEIVSLCDAEKIWSLIRGRTWIKLRNMELLRKKRLFSAAVRRKMDEVSKGTEVPYEDLDFSYESLEKDLERHSFFIENAGDPVSLD